MNRKQQEAIDAVLAGKNVFLTGQAGTGKSEVIKYIVRKMEDRGARVGITSLTGISALAIQGMTIHSWAGVGIADKPADVLTRRVLRGKRKKAWTETQLLIVDEVSMMSVDLFQKLDTVGRAVRRRVRLPFGGLQLLFSGDFCQLAPVEGEYCFETALWDECQFHTVYLTENMRQADPQFQALLARVRLGEITPQDQQVLETRVGAQLAGAMEATRLYARRAQVEAINNRKLDELGPATRRAFTANDEVATTQDIQRDRLKMALERVCPARARLELAIGAQVMLLVNYGSETGLANGSRGVVEGYSPAGFPVVRFVHRTETIQPHEWTIQVDEETQVFRKQIPLTLAYASTIHKCQGATLDAVQVSLGSEIFSDGQFYVALSRVRTLEGLTILDLDTSRLRCNDRVKRFYTTINV